MHGVHLLHHVLVSRHAGDGGHFRSGVRRSGTAGKAETGGAERRENGRCILNDKYRAYLNEITSRLYVVINSRK